MTELEKTDPAPPPESIVRAVRIEFSGPLPHPQVLAQYNEALPNGAERIMQMTESELRHRQGMEHRGQFFAFVIAVAALLGGIVLIALGRSVEGLVPLLSAIAGLGGTLIYREIQSQKDEAELFDEGSGSP